MAHKECFFTVTFSVLVNYARSLKEAVKAGCYHGVHESISQDHFPFRKKKPRVKTFRLYNFPDIRTIDEITEVMAKDGYRPANLLELLAVGEHQPNLQKKFPLVALGSAWAYCCGCDYTCLLWGIAGERHLLAWFNKRWSSDCHFLGVKK